MCIATSLRWRFGRAGWCARPAGSRRRRRLFADSFCSSDEVALEATGNTHAIVRLLERRVARVVVLKLQKTRAIAEAKVKTDKVDAEILAQLLAADYLPWGGVAGPMRPPRRAGARSPGGRIWSASTPGNQLQAILHRNLVPRCPAADLFGGLVDA